MFSKKPHADVKKSTQKLQDPKKDSATRFKHLKIILDHIDVEEAKLLFETNYCHIYYVVYDCFINADNNLKQKVHKAHREELEAVLNVLDKILILLPELLSKRWQCHSLSRILTKLLHPGNSYKLRREAIRYFLIWYQILGENSPDEVHALFATLVPGFFSPFPEYQGLCTLNQSSSATVFHDTQHGPVSFFEIQPVYPSPSGEKQPDDPTRYFLEALLEFMVSQVSRIEWRDKFYKQHRCFNFLFERFKEYYLPHIFPDFSKNTNLFKPYLEIPTFRVGPFPEVFLSSKVAVIKWVSNFTHLTKTHPGPQVVGAFSSCSVISESESERSPGSDLRRVSVGQSGNDTPVIAPFSPPVDLHIMNESPNTSAFQIVKDVLYMNRENVNFIHEVYRQAFLLNFTHASAIRRVISVYKDWIQMNVIELPPFMLEPLLDQHRSSGPSSIEFSPADVLDDNSRSSRVRNESYLGAINKDNTFVRAGMQNVLQVFVTDAANVFLLDTGAEISTLLDQQVDVCKRVLNIYRYMVMQTHMEARTWEQLLMVLLHITSVILNPSPPKRKEETLGGRLAPAIFQTLIVTWIKANLNVVISRELWDQFLGVLSSLTQWEELIKEWAKTLETLTRVLARHVYGLELNDLPLDRLSEQKSKKQRGGIKTDKCETTQQIEHESLSKSSITNDINVRVEKYNCYSALRRSASETNLIYRRRKMTQEQLKKSDVDRGLSTDSDIYDSSIERKNVSFRNYVITRRWRSLDSVKVNYSSGYEDSEYATRTPSPAPSSGVESNSFKDSPMQIEVINSEGTNLVDIQDGKSVMSGGSVKGWLPDVAAVLWLRMLGSLGDINKISEPTLHLHVFQFLIELFETLMKIRLNQGIPSENVSITPPVPELVPPMTLLAPWCFQALSLPSAFHSGKLCAFRLLCNMTVMVHDIPLHPKHLSLFYTALHEGLLSNDQSVVNTLVKYCGPRFFSLQLPGFSLLTLDFIQATDSIVSSNEVRNTPRSEAISILGALLSLPDQILKMPVLTLNTTEMCPLFCPDIRDRVISIILKAGKTETAGVARCIALSNLGIFLYQELCKDSRHPKIKEAINTLLLALRFNHKTVAQSASDVLLLLCDHSDTLYRAYPEIPPRIIEVLVGTLSHLMPIGDSDKRLLTSLLFCLGEWTMSLPIQRLILNHNGTSLLCNVFKVLDDLSEGGKGKGVQVGSFHPDLVQEFNSNITYDDLKQQDLPQQRRPVFTSSPVHLISTTHSIQLAAKLVTMHLINNLGHFPLISGGANLGSIVVEQDDVLGLEADQLSSQLFTAPNIQVFVTSLQQVVSLVEVPALDVPGSGAADGLISAPSQVRVIIRDLGGKASWDASVLHGTLDLCEKQESLCEYPGSELQVDNSILNPLPVNTLPQDTLRHRPPYVLPTFGNSAQDMDNLDDLLQYIGYTSPEVLESLDLARNVPPASINLELEEEAMGAILGMRIMHHANISQSSTYVEGVKKTSVDGHEDIAPFQYCRLLFSQFGMHGWDLRSQLYLVDKNEKLLREMRNLDSQHCRQTHKVAVIYVAQGQEDKNSILSNSGGSQAYEDFIAGLAWEVELETHMGFRGGLQRNKMTGVTAPYYATSFTEVIFHVATRMPSNNPEALLQKTRHLGNDEVHIVWSEHTREYRRGIIPTEFCDVLIVIYPLPHNLYRIQVSRKPDVPYFGPLYNEALVGHMELPGLVRATALSASRAKRSMLPFYQQYYEERGRSLEAVIKNFKKQTTFEEFAANIYSPQEYNSSNICQSNTGSNSLNNAEECSSSVGSNSSSTLAALLDSTPYRLNQHSHTTDDSGTSYMGAESEISSCSGVSPRPLKKIGMKPGSKKTQPLLTPPDSPTSKRSK